MNEGWKVAAAVALACAFAADFGDRAATYFAGLTLTINPQEKRNAEGGGDHDKANFNAVAHSEDGTNSAKPEHYSVNTNDSDIWVIFQGASAPIVAFFTAVLVVVAGQQNRLSRRQMTIAYRPRLRVRNFEIKHSLTIASQADRKTGFIYGESIECHFTVANIGGTNAIIVESNAFLIQTATRLTGRPYDGETPPAPVSQPVMPKTSIPAGESRRAFFNDLSGLTPETIASMINVLDGHHGVWRLYVIGYVRYEDANGARRNTTFCRLYDITERRFKRLADNDEDYDAEE